MKIILLFGLFLIFSLMASVLPADAKPDKFLKDNYIVKFRDGVTPNMKYDWKITHTYETIFNGIAVEIKNPGELNRLLKDASVDRVRPVELFELAYEMSISAIPPDIETKQYIKPGTTRHNFHLNPSVNAGDGITNVPIRVAVVDTGGTLEHPDLNYILCLDFTNSVEGCDDLNGHGTHTAGTIAAINNNFGVVGGAPGAGIIALKVCGAGGSNTCGTNAILAAWDWLATNGKENGILVNNNSWGGNAGSPVEDGNCGFTDGDLIHQALCAMTDVGIVTVVSAGNSNADGKTFLACGYDEVICVSAMDDTDGLPGGIGPDSTCRSSSDDTIASFSNYGNVVDISADGVCEPSTVPDCSNNESICDPSGYKEISGTSMSSPQATGGIALAIVHLCGFDGCNNREEVLAVNNFIKGTGFPINGLDGFFCNKPSGCAEPLLNAETYTFEVREPFHDVSLTFPLIQNPVGQGFTEDIAFTALNIGTFTETFTIQLEIDGKIFLTDTVTLGELQSENYNVSWTPDTLGTFTLTTSILNIPVEDSNPDNNGGTILINVIERIRDVSVKSLLDKKPNNWVAGVSCQNCLRLTIINNGNFPEDLTTKLIHVDSGTSILARTHTLVPGKSVSFSVDVRSTEMTVLDGVNTFQGKTSIIPGDDPSDNVKFLEIIASEENRHHNIRAVLLSGDTNGWDEDETGLIKLWCQNEGTEQLTNPRLSYGILEGEELLKNARTPTALVNGEGKFVNFNFAPFSLSVGEHTITGFCDNFNEYDERDETNNSFTRTFTVREGSTPPPPDPEPPEPPTDTTPPIVMITNPVDGHVITGKSIIIVNAEDESGIASVQIKVDGKNLKGADTEAPYIQSWQSKSKKDGNYTMEAVACDNAGNCASHMINITVSNGKDKP